MAAAMTGGVDDQVAIHATIMHMQRLSPTAPTYYPAPEYTPTPSPTHSPVHHALPTPDIPPVYLPGSASTDTSCGASADRLESHLNELNTTDRFQRATGCILGVILPILVISAWMVGHGLAQVCRGNWDKVIAFSIIAICFSVLDTIWWCFFGFFSQRLEGVATNCNATPTRLLIIIKHVVSAVFFVALFVMAIANIATTSLPSLSSDCTTPGPLEMFLCWLVVVISVFGYCAFLSAYQSKPRSYTNSDFSAAPVPTPVVFTPAVVVDVPPPTYTPHQ